MPGLVLDIIDLRGYARTRDMVERSKPGDDIEMTPMVEQVFAVQHALMQRRATT